MPVDQATIPHRFRRVSFEFYENEIRDIVNRFPKVCIFDPKARHRTPDTFECRLRDAIRAACTYGYISDRFNNSKLRDIYTSKQLVVAQRKGLIYAGGRADVHELFEQPQEIASALVGEEAIESVAFDHSITSWEELRIICLLAADRQLKAPLLITISDPLWATSALESFDIELIPQPHPIWLLL